MTKESKNPKGIERYQPLLKFFKNFSLVILRQFSLKNGVKLEEDPESAEDSTSILEMIDQHLKTGSVVFYANHTSYLDMLSVLFVLNSLENVRSALYPVAEKYTSVNTKYKFSFVAFPIIKLFSHLGIMGVPVPQGRSKDLEDLSENERKARKNKVKKLDEKVAKLLQSPGSIIGITPEGKRSPQLIKLKTGIARIALQILKNLLDSDSNNTIFVPVSMVYEKEEMIIKLGNPHGIDFVKDILKQIIDLEEELSNLDKPEEIESREAEIYKLLQDVADKFGAKIAMLLPEEMRGDYGENQQSST